MEGLVMKSTGSWYIVRTEDGEMYRCRLRGKIKLKDLKVSNPIAVGDLVEFELEEAGESTGAIHHIAERENYIIRKSTHKTAHSHIIAANIDRALLVVTLVSPRTSFGFIDRFLVTAEAYDIPVTLIYNKSDLYDPETAQYQNQILKMYDQIGYSGIICSTVSGQGISEIKELLAGHKTLFSGHSGVGKSTLINQLSPELELKTSVISDYSDKGKHTTTYAEMFELAPDTYIIDTPGIKELGLVDIPKEELSYFFPEMRERLNQCKYYNCLHINEPGCAVLKDLKAGKISLTRYESYRSIMDETDNRR
ncbi:ribosome small subunit-dependent GTPase A [Adhaeribacter radiodurans]|uniref:Small ribosomal subunit biogenesis GTPase RsgA n=1 Tax=Adhaeribacter radiodurans TaxID=2745197 RepID=A0A7L7L567_9BACT|nr:ribosome small subunit-dependent GTPase A [Adhaeribacter radiodurans]QMU27946.1 ribosome small subunit-dependent GTPase A [Adhaeribacter radiodurans]